jgi:hypothetical protein
MTEHQRRLLLELQQSALRGAFAVACDGPDRKPARDLERLGYAEWRGESFVQTMASGHWKTTGSSFWSVTQNGLTALAETE